jgi:hypothetical protein
MLWWIIQLVLNLFTQFAGHLNTGTGGFASDATVKYNVRKLAV